MGGYQVYISNARHCPEARFPADTTEEENVRNPEVPAVTAGLGSDVSPGASVS